MYISPEAIRQEWVALWLSKLTPEQQLLIKDILNLKESTQSKKLIQS